MYLPQQAGTTPTTARHCVFVKTLLGLFACILTSALAGNEIENSFNSPSISN